MITKFVVRIHGQQRSVACHRGLRTETMVIGIAKVWLALERFARL